MNDLYKINQYINLFENINIKIKDTKSLIYILKENGISPVALKVLSTNKLYTDIWNINLPSVESLDSVGSNKVYNNLIISQLENKISIAEEGLKNIFKKIKNSFSSLWNKISKRKIIIEKISKLWSKLRFNKSELDKTEIDKLNNTDDNYITLEEINNIHQLIKELRGDDIVNLFSSKKPKEQLKLLVSIIKKPKSKTISMTKTQNIVENLMDDILKGNSSIQYKTINEINKISESLNKYINNNNLNTNHTNFTILKISINLINKLEKQYTKLSEKMYSLFVKNAQTITKIEALMQKNLINDQTPGFGYILSEILKYIF